MIKHEGSKYVLYSKDGSKKLGTFDSKKEAEDREKEINRIKHAKGALVDISLTITKASVQDDGSIRWQAVTSDTDPDRTGEQTSLPLFQDWIERVETGKPVSYLPPPRTPFLGLSHYPSLDGLGEAGPTEKMYVDGSTFKASGVFYRDTEHPLGSLLADAVRKEQALIRKGEAVKNPIRISAAWWDISHAHGDFVFERKSLADKCPMCESGADSKIYLKGQLDHFAATRVPINPRTSLALEEKAMTVTRKDDANSIITDDELVEEIDKRAKLTGKSEAEELPEAMVVRAKDEGKKAMAKKKPKDADTEEDESDAETMDGEEEEEEEFPFNKKKKGKMADGEKAKKADVEQMGEMEEGEKHYMPFGGALTLSEAEAYNNAQRQAGEVYSNWAMFDTVMRNILEVSEPKEVKGRMEKALSEFSDRVAAIKAAIEDVSLIEPVTDDSPVKPEKGVIEMTSNTQQAAAQKAHPFEVAKSQYDEIMSNASLSREQKLQALQEQFNNLGNAVKAEMDAVAPPSVEEAISKSMAPFVDKLSLLIERLGNSQPQQPTAQPQQKSFAPAMAHQPQQPAQDAGPTPKLRSMIRRSVGIQQ